MSVHWSYWLPIVLGVVLTVGSARADDDKNESKGKGRGGDNKESRGRDKDDEFEKRYREQQKKYEEQRREGQKRYEEQRREGQKRDGEWQRKLEEQYREDQKRQDEWRKEGDKEGRKQFEEQLKRQMRDAGRPGGRQPNFGPVHMSPPTWPPFGAVPDQTRLPIARRAAAEYGPEFSRALAGLEAGERGFDPRATQVAADLVRRSERLTELARRDADLGAIRQEYAAVDAGWRQLSPYLDQAAREPGTRELTWRLYLTERQFRGAIGYDVRTAGPNWSTAKAVARDQSTRLGQLVTMARQDDQIDVNLVYDLRNAQREAQAFEELVAERVRAEELREQHDYLAAALARVTGQLQAVRREAPLLILIQQVVVTDRHLCGELGLPVYQDDSTRDVIARAAELKVAADRLRRDFWAVLGSSDKDVIAYYVQPSDQLAAHADLVHQMLVEGRPMELIQAGWQHVVEWNEVVGERVEALDQRQFSSIHRLANDSGRLVQEVNTFFVPDRPRR